MKKLLLCFMSFIMVITLIGCSNNSNNNNNNQENNTTNNNGIIEIEITLDNWSDYFTIKEYDAQILNANKEITDVFKDNVILLKEGFEIAKESKIFYDVTYSYDYRYFEKDLEKGTITFKDKYIDEFEGYVDNNSSSRSSVLNCTLDEFACFDSLASGLEVNETEKWSIHYYDFEITGISGTLYLTK